MTTPNTTRRRRTTLLMRAYRVLAAIDNQWPTRHTAEGQKLLVDLRDAIVEETGLEAEHVQDEASVPLDMSKFKPFRMPV